MVTKVIASTEEPAREANPDGEGELREKHLRNRFAIGRIIAVGPRNGPDPRGRAVVLRNECENGLQGRQEGVCSAIAGEVE